MINTPWGLLPVADAHVHFFSHWFFASLADQKGVPVDQLAPLLKWQLPAEDPSQLADTWAQELDKHGVAKAALIASLPGDGDSVIAAVGRHPERFYGYVMVNPTAIDVGATLESCVTDACNACIWLAIPPATMNGPVGRDAISSPFAHHPKARSD